MRSINNAESIYPELTQWDNELEQQKLGFKNTSKHPESNKAAQINKGSQDSCRIAVHGQLLEHII